MADGEAPDLDEVLAFSLAFDKLRLRREAFPPPSSSSSSASSSRALYITCDLCNRARTIENCYLDMHGCSHALCLGCLYSAASAACPVPSCRTGSIPPDDVPPPPPAPPSEIECGICMESKEPSESFFDIKGCDHVFCSECIARYVAAKVEENAVEIPCPDPTCPAGSLELDACRGVLPHELFLRWGAALCENSIEGSAKFYCPYRDCSALLVAEEEPAEEGGVDCPHCQRRVCVACKTPWHEGVSCEEYRRLGDGERAAEDLMLVNLARRSKWQRCPKCGFYVERVSGCVFIMCRCKFCFCYQCGSEMQDSRHYCDKCKCSWSNN